MNILFVFPHVVRGGIETLMMRMSAYYKANGHNVTLCCRDIMDQIKHDLISKGVSVRYYDAIEDNDIESMDMIVSAHVEDYMRYFRYALKNKTKYKNILYILHPFDLLRLGYYGPKHLDFIGWGVYKRFIRKAFESGSIIFMDEMCFRESDRELTLHKGENKSFICIPLPLPFSPLETDMLDRKVESRKTEINILTVSRADYPSKGYIKGLIEIFNKLCKDNNNLHLTIVSSYDGVGDKDCMERLRNWVRLSANSNIELIEGLGYDALLEKYNCSHLYIGMGTTTIEAASRLNIVIPVECYTYECKSWGFFNNRIEWVGTDWNCGSDVTQLIQYAINMSDEDFRKIVIDTYEKARKQYDIEINAEKLINLKVDDHPDKLMKIYNKILSVDDIFLSFARKVKHMVC